MDVLLPRAKILFSIFLLHLRSFLFVRRHQLTERACKEGLCTTREERVLECVFTESALLRNLFAKSGRFFHSRDMTVVSGGVPARLDPSVRATYMYTVQGSVNVLLQ